MKSVSNETSFAADLTERGDIEAAISAMAAKVGRRLRRKGLAGRTLTLKLRYDDRTIRSAQRRLENGTDDDLAFIPTLLTLLDEIWRPGIPVRLVGVAMSAFDEEAPTQEHLFDLPEDDLATVQPKLSEEKRAQTLKATDKLKKIFHESAIRFGHEIKAHKTTGSAAKNPRRLQVTSSQSTEWVQRISRFTEVSIYKDVGVCWSGRSIRISRAVALLCELRPV